MGIPNKIPLAAPHTFKWNEDTARRLLELDEYERPYLSLPGVGKFVWPVGTEGFGISGQADLAIHKYLGDNDIEVEIVHFDERRIEMSGTFPGHSATWYMRDLIAVMTAKSNKQKVLGLPGLFPRTQLVDVENYNFSHDPEDRTRSVSYQITFVRSGAGRPVPRSDLDDPLENPIEDNPPKGDPIHIFRVRAGFRTLRNISAKVYGDPRKWRKLWNLNKVKLRKLGFTLHSIQHKRLPLGTKIRY